MNFRGTVYGTVRVCFGCKTEIKVLKQPVALKKSTQIYEKHICWSFTLKIDPVYVMHTDGEENKQHYQKLPNICLPTLF
jgi:hypothetical protein